MYQAIIQYINLLFCKMAYLFKKEPHFEEKYEKKTQDVLKILLIYSQFFLDHESNDQLRLFFSYKQDINTLFYFFSELIVYYND